MYIFIFGNYYLKYNLTSGEATVHNSKYKKQLKTKIDKYGYYRVQLRRNGKNTQVRLHSIISSFFLGERAELCVNHINGVKTDNKIHNLEYVTKADNIRHAYRIGLMPKKNKPDPLYTKKYYLKNKSKILERVTKYRLVNRDIINKKKLIAYYKNKGCNLKPAELLLELEINKQEF